MTTQFCSFKCMITRNNNILWCCCVRFLLIWPFFTRLNMSSRRRLRKVAVECIFCWFNIPIFDIKTNAKHICVGYRAIFWFANEQKGKKNQKEKKTIWVVRNTHVLWSKQRQTTSQWLIICCSNRKKVFKCVSVKLNC